MSRTPQEDLNSHIEAIGNQDLTVTDAPKLPHSVMLIPVKSQLQIGAPTAGELVGVLGVVLPWERYLTNAVPEGVAGITAVLENSCGQAFTYLLEGNTVCFVSATCPCAFNCNFIVACLTLFYIL